MRRYATVLATLFLVTNGAIVSPDMFWDFPKLEDLIPQDLNLTEYSIAVKADHPHAHLKVLEVIRLYGYVAEAHHVETKDGYILEMHRIAGNRTNPSPANKPVVILMHGLLCSSMDWVIAGPDRGLGFILADAGYDVWMGNARGNIYSRLHSTLSDRDPKYWGFSWHEIGSMDLPTMIDYVLETTSQKKLYYVGHSQGSTTFFVMMTELPQYNEKVRATFLLGPVAYCSNMISPMFQFLSRILKPITMVAKWIGQYEFKPSSMFFNKFKDMLCSHSLVAEKLCMNAIFLITGFNKKQFDMDLLPAILAHTPAGSAVDQFVHYGQVINSGNFRKFDYGMTMNWLKYRSIKPPQYNLNNVKVPVSLHYSINDWLSHPRDVEKLYTELPNTIGKFRVPDDKFNHIDYLWAKDVKVLVYDKIMNLMKRYKI
ncbi:lipase 3-like [Copidosoma floridanum]|uniref:lipase 3-like n=1 Tax=Copidosoma floridanum TaxID=29053 RepID=UPI0006C97E69|nr:lipase 3-like [Copidosoma floridanum]